MGPWLVIAVVVAAVLAVALAFRVAIRREPAEPWPPRADGDRVSPRDDLARNAGIASFGLNPPWRRPRGDSRGRRPR